MSKWYVPYDDDEKVGVPAHALPVSLKSVFQVRLRGEVHRLVAPRDQKYQSNFVEVSRVRVPFGCVKHYLTPASSSSATTRLFTGVTRVSSFVCVLMTTTMSWRTWKQYIYSSKCLVRFTHRPIPSHSYSDQSTSRRLILRQRLRVGPGLQFLQGLHCLASCLSVL